MNCQTSATDESSNNNVATNSASMLSSSSHVVLSTAKIDDGPPIASSAGHSPPIDASALPTSKKNASSEEHLASLQQNNEGQVHVQDAPSKAAIDPFSSTNASFESTSQQAVPSTKACMYSNEVSCNAFRPRKKEIHYLSDIFLQDFRDLLASDIDSDNDTDEETH